MATTTIPKTPAGVPDAEPRPPRVVEELKGPVRFMDSMTPESLAKLKRLAPEIMNGIDNELGDQQCRIFDLITEACGSDWTKTADVLEFARGLSKPPPDLDDIRERVNRLAGLVQGAVLTEACFTNAGLGNLYGDPSDYFSAVCGTIRTASSELARLQKLLNGAREGGAE